MSCKISTAIVVAVVVSVLAACGNEPPKCSDDDTSFLVRKIILDQFGGGEGLSEKEIKDNMKIEFPRARAFDEKIKKYSCDAKLIVMGRELPITYESQLDDKGQHIVSVYGISRYDSLSLEVGIEKLRKIRTNNVAEPAEAPAPILVEQPAPAAAQDSYPTPVEAR